MRLFLVLLQRWLGLFIALFLLIAALTGVMISWEHELDEWLNPQLFKARSGSEEEAGEPLSLVALAAQAEAADPLHSGRILGLPGRILISVMGLVVAMLSVTGIAIWARKRRARLVAGVRKQNASAATGPLPAESGDY